MFLEVFWLDLKLTFYQALSFPHEAQGPISIVSQLKLT